MTEFNQMVLEKIEQAARANKLEGRYVREILDDFPQYDKATIIREIQKTRRERQTR